ncbi:MAG: Coenzyme F420 hydrogenase/dehydrogenase, beta subunit C-terminal domain [Syntrophomonadaceae bacterium]|nr:Coenzyme F420 hydrogenase/dehydrogenase, beta subunit C-terminal domain [Syntrophomonadaceae bacterium]
MPRGVRELQAEVLDRNLCAGCGMCVGMCPYLKTIEEKVAVIHPCGLEEGNCYLVCPRGLIDLDQLDCQVFGEKRRDPALGHHLALSFSRAVDREIASKSQYGGTVSALNIFALEQGYVDAVVCAQGKGAGFPVPMVARSREEVLACGRSKYSACPTLMNFHQAVREGSRRTGVVGRPCQVIAVRKLQGLTAGNQAPHLPQGNPSLVIGLFCFWALSPQFYPWLAGQVDPEQVTGMDIPQEGLEIETASGIVRWPVDQVRPLIRPACLQCFDCTAEFADISVGSTEWDLDWNTLVVRTQQGAKLVEEAKRAGVLEVKPYPSEREPLLRRAALNKKLRVLQGMEKGEITYLSMSDSYQKQVRSLGVQVE